MLQSRRLWRNWQKSSGVFSQDRIQERTVEQTIPAISLAETIVVVACHSDARNDANEGVNTHVQHVANAVEVEKPKIIELTVQRKKFIIQEKINRGDQAHRVKIHRVTVLGQGSSTYPVVVQTTGVHGDCPKEHVLVVRKHSGGLPLSHVYRQDSAEYLCAWRRDKFPCDQTIQKCHGDAHSCNCRKEG